MPDGKHDVARRLDALIQQTVPELRKAVGWNSRFYGVEGKGWFVSYRRFTRYIKLVRNRAPGTRRS